MAEFFKKRIIKLLKNSDYTPLQPSKLAKVLGVTSQEYPLFKTAFEELLAEERLVVGSHNLVNLPPLPAKVIGKFRANAKGFGFVIPADPYLHGDVFIPPNATAEAMTGDTVLVRVSKKGKRGGQMLYSGKIKEILERANNKFVGTLRKTNKGWQVQPDGREFTEPISVDDITAKGATEKDKVVVEILSYPSSKSLARGVIIEVLGKAGRYESEIKSVIRQFHLPGEFGEDCLNQARGCAGSFDAEQAENREDISEKMIVTIDPPDSKDFDDAISIEKDSQGNWVLGVHIADVSCFIEPGSALDLEAKNRGNSVYLPGKTIPMLPEILSNGICSLQPGQKRFAKSAYMTYDAVGNVKSRRFANNIMQSSQRLSYQQADRILKGHNKDNKPGVVELLKNMETLSRVIEKRRFKNEMLRLDMPETELVMDKAGRVVDAHPADDSYPHTIIEMFMVEANEAVASLLDKINKDFLRRIHPEPNAFSMQNLSKLVRVFGLTIPKKPNRSDIQNLLNGVKGSDYSIAVNLVVLRSLEKAEYSPANIGHYALASKKYCHFTSPIRRYADLLVHRILQNYLETKLDSDAEKEIASKADLTEIGKHITFMEQQAEGAERELKMALTLQLLNKNIGMELECVTTGITSFGVFAQSLKFGIEGLIQTSDLGGDEWEYNQKTKCLKGVSSGKTIHLGQPVKVKIVSVNIPARQLNVVPAAPLVDADQVRKKQKTRKRRMSKHSRRKR